MVHLRWKKYASLCLWATFTKGTFNINLRPTESWAVLIYSGKFLWASTSLRLKFGINQTEVWEHLPLQYFGPHFSEEIGNIFIHTCRTISIRGGRGNGVFTLKNDNRVFLSDSNYSYVHTFRLNYKSSRIKTDILHGPVSQWQADNDLRNLITDHDKIHQWDIVKHYTDVSCHIIICLHSKYLGLIFQSFQWNVGTRLFIWNLLCEDSFSGWLSH